MSESRIVVETPCEHGVSGPCGMVTGYPTEPVTLEECGGGDTRIIDPENLPSEVIEAAARAMAEAFPSMLGRGSPSLIRMARLALSAAFRTVAQ